MFSLISGQIFFLVSCSSSHDIALHASSCFTKWWLPFSISYSKNIYSWSEVVSQMHCPYMWVSIFQMKRLCQQVFVPWVKKLSNCLLRRMLEQHLLVPSSEVLKDSFERNVFPWERAPQQTHNSLQCFWKFWGEECMTCLSHCFLKDFWWKGSLSLANG